MPEAVIPPLIAQGILGIFVVIFGVVAVALFWALMRSQKERVEELKLLIPLVTRGHEQSDTIADIIGERGKLDIASTAALTALGVKIDNLSKEVERRMR